MESKLCANRYLVSVLVIVYRTSATAQCLVLLLFLKFIVGVVAVHGLNNNKFVCPGAGSYPNPDDCSTYYVCSVSSPTEHNVNGVLMNCPSGLLYDPTLKICNNAASVVCSQSTTAPSTTTARPTTSTTLRPSTSTTTVTPKTTTSSNGPHCPAVGPDFVENSADCTSFYSCSNGLYVLNKCPTGFGFDPDTKECVVGSSIGCSTEPTPTIPSSPIECPSTGDHIYPNTESCQSFYICIDGVLSPVTCPINYEFDTISQRCEPSGTAACNGIIPSTPKPIVDCSSKPVGTMLPNLTNCNMYYVCTLGGPVSNKCPPGLEFNAAKSVCDTPDGANCQENIVIRTLIGKL